MLAVVQDQKWPSAQAQLRQANRRAALIAEAIAYLEKTGDREPAETRPVSPGRIPNY